MGIFNKSNQPDPKVNRNSFDLSFASSGTFKFGTLYPVFLKEVLPGDSFRINGAFGLRFMPLAFPIQTKVRADIHFFYVRNRNLWKDWPNFIGQTGRPSAFPVLSQSNKERLIKTSALGDYLGLPTTIVGRESVKISDVGVTFVSPRNDTTRYSVDYSSIHQTSETIPFSINQSVANLFRVGVSDPTVEQYNSEQTYFGTSTDLTLNQPYVSGVDNFLEVVINDVFSENLPSTIPTGVNLRCVAVLRTSSGSYVSSLPEIPVMQGQYYELPDGSIGFRFPYTGALVSRVVKFIFFYDDISNTDGNLSSQKGTPFVGSIGVSVKNPNLTLTVYRSIGSSVAKDPEQTLSFDISALPFRAYESIYNSFYRDQRNNPYIVNGVQDPNVYLPTTEGGIDSSSYDFRQRNWEQDFLTSAVPSPQQGVAPLVGITSTGVATFDVDGTPYSAQLETAEDGDTVVSARLGSDAPASVRSSVVSLATSGISINDFRGVNALQRFLETNMRRGLKYKDQIMSHYGVDVSFAELDMPEFLGGFSEFVNIDQINNMTESEGSSPLGSYAGQASCVGSSKHTINRFCDEHGFIVGILSIVPVPTYSQLLPKHFTKFDPLDYFFPEFGHLGYQPIPYKEVCPFQAQAYGVSPYSTFGYQRAWYDYLASVDEVHGLFRTQLQSFILTRVFNGVPSLNEDFLLVHPDSLNDIFTVTKDSDGNPVDPILGQLYFDVTAKRKIPRYGVPRLE